MTAVNPIGRPVVSINDREERLQQLVGLVDVVTADVEELFGDSRFVATLENVVQHVASDGPGYRHGTSLAFIYDGTHFSVTADVDRKMYRLQLHIDGPAPVAVAVNQETCDALHSGNMSPAEARATVAALLRASTIDDAWAFVCTLNRKSAARLAKDVALFPGTPRLGFELAVASGEDARPVGLRLGFIFDEPAGAAAARASEVPNAGGSARTLHDAGLAGFAAAQAHAARVGVTGEHIGARLGAALLAPAFLQVFQAALEGARQRAVEAPKPARVQIGSARAYVEVVNGAGRRGPTSVRVTLDVKQAAAPWPAPIAVETRTSMLDGVDGPGPVSPDWLTRLASVMTSGLYLSERGALAKAIARGVTAGASAACGPCLSAHMSPHGLELCFSADEAGAAMEGQRAGDAAPRTQ